jgi:nucleoid-associated protein YgaU
VLTASENEQIIAALAQWAATAPNEPVIGILGGGEMLRPWEIVAAVQQRTEAGEAILEILEHGLRREGVDKVVSRLVGDANRDPRVEIFELPQRHKIYTVRPGDSLWTIAERVFGNGEEFPKLIAANPGKVKHRNSVVLPGDRLVIPE